MKEHNLIWSNNKAIFNVISDNTVWEHRVNLLSVNFRSDYIIYCPFQMQKQIFLHSLAIWHEKIKPLDLIKFNKYLIIVFVNSDFSEFWWLVSLTKDWNETDDYNHHLIVNFH